MTTFAAPQAVLDRPVGDLTNAPPVAAAFADPGRNYPVHTKAAAWASAAHSHAGGGTDPKAAGRIKTALDDHRLFGEWDRLAAAARPPAPPAPTAYALPAAGRYPIDTPAEVKQAADYFAEHADRFPDADRAEFARNVATAARPHPGLLPASAAARLEAEGGLGRLAPGWKRAFDDRARLARRNGNEDLGAAVEAAGAEVPADYVKAATVLRRLDKAAGFDLGDPLDTLVGDTPTTATSKLAGVVPATDGSWYEKAALDAVPDETLAHLFGTPAVVSGATRAALLASPDQSAAYRAVLADHGVGPVEAAPFQRPDWAAVAALAR